MFLERASHPEEIDQRLNRRYLDRLSDKVRRLRRELQERNWDGIRTEVRQLKGSGTSFGLPGLTRLATDAEQVMPRATVSRSVPLPEARKAVEKLIAGIDAILAEKFVPSTRED